VKSALLMLAALLPQGPQAEPDVFTRAQVAIGDTGRKQWVVEADQRQIDCLQALRGLCKVMNWNLSIESKPLENDLRFASVNLNLEGQNPRMVAHLLAVAAGADSLFHDPDDGIDGARSTLHIVRVPTGDTESGRQRLRSIAGQWYRSFLREELQYEPIVQQEGLAVRMNLGKLLVDSGDLESAIGFFTDVYERQPHDQVAAAALRIAQCHLDRAEAQSDRAKKMEQFALAEQWVRNLLERLPTAPEIPQATILLGRALLGQAMAEADREQAHAKAKLCQDELRARIIRMLDSVELLEVWLLAGEAQFLMDRSDRVYDTMLTLRDSPYFEDLGPDHYREYHFLLGFGALGAGKPELAMRSLEWFLIHADEDERRGQAYVMLAESYLQQKRFVEARAAAVEARKRYLGGMTSDWRERTLRVWARSALALGEKESAFLELEQMVLRGEEPELTLFLVDELLADRQWQRAMAVARPLVDLEGSIGDAARFKTVKALYEQAVASKHLDDFPPQAIPIAPRIKDAELRAEVATMIGEAYTRLGKLEHAADAFRGILR